MNKQFSEKSLIERESHLLSYSEGLRIYMQNVYSYMATGLGFTGGVALLVASSPVLFNTLMPLQFLFMLATLGIVWFLSARLNTLSYSAAQGLFWLYSALNGVTFSTLFLLYTYESVARVFFITAATFAAMSLYGYTTRKDLTSFGSYFFMGLIGLVIASVVNMFLASSGFQFLLSILGVILFTGLTAYDTQRVKEEYIEGNSEEIVKKRALFGALRLYLDFINLFILMLRILGNRRD